MSSKNEKEKGIGPMDRVPLGNKEEQKRYWRWRIEVGRLVKQEVPDHILIPVTKEKYMEMYKEGLMPHDVRNYIVYQLLN